MMMPFTRLRRPVMGLLCATLFLFADAASAQVTPPAPETLLDKDANMVAVIEARADDAGFRALLRTAWIALREEGGEQESPASPVDFPTDDL